MVKLRMVKLRMVKLRMVKLMPQWLRRGMRRGMILVVMLMVVVGGWATGGWAIFDYEASARVMQEHLPGDVTLDKSLRTIKDAKGYSWQAIAFKVTRNGSSDSPYLRLVGFPGAIFIDRAHPLIVTTPAGDTFTLEDKSFLIFKDGKPPQPNVAQYELGNVLRHLQTSTRLRLTLPVLDDGNDDGRSGASDPTVSGTVPAEAAIAPLELSIPRSMVDEWFLVACEEAKA